jgi:hypothetical protein
MTLRSEAMTDLDELSRLLEQATPGPWKVYEFFPHCHEVCNADNYATGAVCVPPKQANAALIAALRNHAEELVRDARRWRCALRHPEVFAQWSGAEAEAAIDSLLEEGM